MAERTIVLGPVTAYGEARRGGYTGSKEEFEQILAGLGNINEKQDKLSGTSNQYVGFDANGNAVAKTPSITPSPDPFSSHAILDESGVANLVMGETTTKVDKVVSPTAGNIATLTQSGGIEDSGTSVAALQNAIDNITPKRTASNDPPSSSFSVLCDTAIAGQARPKLYGKSVAINQLQYNGNMSSSDGWNGGTVADGWIEITAGAASYAFAYNENNIPEIIGTHKYYACGTIKAVSGLASGSTTIVLRIGGTDSTTEAIYASNITIADGSSRLLEGIFSPKPLSVGTNKRANWGVYNNANAVDAKWTNLNIIDLTAIFTSAELTAIGTSVANLKAAWLKKYGYPLPAYIPYNTGSIVSNNATYQMHGRNIWDEEWEVGVISWSGDNADDGSTRIRSKNYIPCLPSTTYYIKTSASGGNLQIFYYDENKNFLSYEQSSVANRTITTPSNASFIRFFTYITAYGATYNNDICINLSDASFNGTYEAYYNGGAVTADSLNGIGTAVDEQTAEGQEVRAITVDDMGTLPWSYYNGKFVATLPNSRNYTQGQTVNALCAKYPTYPSASSAGHGVDKSMWISFAATPELYVQDSAYSDAATFRAAMSGVMLYYELATPTTDSTSAANLSTQAGYNCLEPVSGDVQSAECECEYAVDIVAYVDSKVADLTALMSSI